MLHRRITSSKSQRKEGPDQTIKFTVLYRFMCDVCLYAIITNLCEGRWICFSAVSCCCTVQPSGCSSTVHVLALCLNVSVTFRSSKYAHLLLVQLRCCKLAASPHSISMLVRLNIADSLKEAIGRPHQKPALACRRTYSAKWEHIEHQLFLLTGHRKALNCVKGRRSNPANYKEGSRQCVDRSNPHWLAFSCVGRAVYLKTDRVNI
jgi:hypothetical protein